RLDSGTMMRSLLFDFPEDKKAAERCDEFMFGKNLLVCPVTEPMYYEAKSREIERDKVWECYLPEGYDWYDIWENKKYEGGQTVTVPAPLDRIPAFAKAGSIIPMRRGLNHAAEDNDEPLELHIYPGADGEFVYYDDAGDGYDYENGEYETVPMRWSDKDRVLVIEERGAAYGGTGAKATDADGEKERPGRYYKGIKAARKLRLFVNDEFRQETGYIDSRLEIGL
ncbi:MAG: DUF5110 domain-containing protein, partial [Lachnospiraceae bacterium]|nr:DUF5110 domain-containing protein [Lachnospiraceae bacterium]